MTGLPVLSTPDERVARAREMVAYLKEAYPVPKTELHYETPFQLVAPSCSRPSARTRR